jgi:hypothetical protein
MLRKQAIRTPSEPEDQRSSSICENDQERSVPSALPLQRCHRKEGRKDGFSLLTLR